MTNIRRHLIVATALAGFAHAGAAQTFEHTVPPGNNFDKAIFRMWVPSNPGTLRGAVVLVPGSNGDGRGMVTDTLWQAFATKNHFALVGCQFTDKPHDQGFIEDYVNVANGSGQALLDALTALGKASQHTELATAPFFMWGMSAGGQFDYEFTAWKPERVIAFVANKGGIYYTALASRAARNVPGLLFIGGKDLEQRVATITGLFFVNRRGGALWALTEEPSAAHAVARSRDFAAIYFEDVLPLRVDGGALKPLTEKSGFWGFLHEKTIQRVGDSPASPNATVWLPTERVARAWQAVVTEKPFDQ